MNSCAMVFVQKIVAADAASNVRVHSGNDINDLEGCFVAWKSRSAEFIGNGFDAMNDISAILDSDNGAITVICPAFPRPPN